MEVFHFDLSYVFVKGGGQVYDELKLIHCVEECSHWVIVEFFELVTIHLYHLHVRPDVCRRPMTVLLLWLLYAVHAAHFSEPACCVSLSSRDRLFEGCLAKTLSKSKLGCRSLIEYLHSVLKMLDFLL